MFSWFYSWFCGKRGPGLGWVFENYEIHLWAYFENYLWYEHDFSGMIHLCVYSEIVKSFFTFFMFLPFWGVLRAKNGPKSLLLANFCAKEGSFISRTGFSELIVIYRLGYYILQIRKKAHLRLSCGRHRRQDGEFLAKMSKWGNFRSFEGQNGGKLGENRKNKA